MSRGPVSVHSAAEPASGSGGALVASGVCDAETVDDAEKPGSGPLRAVLGPMAQSDIVGLDPAQAIHETPMPDLDGTDTVHPLLAERAAAGVPRSIITWGTPPASMSVILPTHRP
ncbi:MAG TPA: hypothetical protein DIU07_15265 [Rhodobacteraceae bacterium]|nr:hypothetical protein [Paracoccaceae bacterium]